MELKEAINYYRKLGVSIRECPLPGAAAAEKFQLAEWLEELYNYRIKNNYVVFQFNIDDGLDLAHQMYKKLEEDMKGTDMTVVGIPNTCSLSILQKEELENIWRKLGEILGKENVS